MQLKVEYRNYCVINTLYLKYNHEKHLVIRTLGLAWDF